MLLHTYLNYNKKKDLAKNSHFVNFSVFVNLHNLIFKLRNISKNDLPHTPNTFNQHQKSPITLKI